MSGFYTRFAANVLFPLRERLKGRETVRIRREMEARQWWSRENLLAFQSERLRAFLRDVGAHVPYYRNLFAQTEFVPEEVTSLSGLQRLPFLDAAILRANVDCLRIEGQAHLARFESGAANGEPLLLYVGPVRTSHDIAARWRTLRWWDVDIGDPGIVVWGPPIDADTRELLGISCARSIRSARVLAFEMPDTEAERFIARLRKRRPKTLTGNPSTLAYLAAFAQARDIALNDLGIQTIFAAGERLWASQRELIASSYGCPLVYLYGNRGSGLVASQCPMGGLHIAAENVVVEIVDEDGEALPSGKAGEIILTNTASRDFPFIRYRTGDIGALDWDSCPCGRGLPLLKLAEFGAR
ncbi:MAG: phenylacetate--CoA ligase family protein [Azoarcus sp.]|jgi:phenylacetate-CoA ligase|nr:phenylacetate--CoA ligase family protein [Azoarcus sp.]